MVSKYMIASFPGSPIFSTAKLITTVFDLYCDLLMWRPLPIPSFFSDKAATGVGTQVGVSATTKSAPPTRAFLEKRVQQLEDSLESKDKECSRKLRALQQKHTALEVHCKCYIGYLHSHSI